MSFPKHRCSACGRVRSAIVFAGDRSATVAACPEHPGEPVLEVSQRLHAALLHLHQYRAQHGATWDDVEGAVYVQAGAESPGRDTVLALDLIQKWDGLPERRLPETTNAEDPGVLFGARR